ncbi:hypothetical protein UFOVP80_58 [uncultured Caudovirales phage]|jgi:hypothetical protein|uniref:Uncharacterized protein n=1 Tax=uncultured Caudovirales phage TaxID=2100421 RepID=A0A6J5KW97_9CAUD|nr:hypothetical protein UFOVP80_58 [uncultured Caudovirales phage]
MVLPKSEARESARCVMEYAFYDNDDEKKDAFEYLRLWRKFYLKELDQTFKEYDTWVRENPLLTEENKKTYTGKTSLVLYIKLERRE